jgi:hypothetical protein
MLVLDGNNSLKRMKGAHGREVGDVREFTDSNYFLDNTYVDSFADEIRHPTNRVKQEPEDEIIDGDDGDTTEVDGYTTEVDDPQLETCASNWKAAVSLEKKRMWGIFDETGIFASACPHGFILWLADMVQSGEQCVHSPRFIVQADHLSSGQSIPYRWSRRQ